MREVQMSGLAEKPAAERAEYEEQMRVATQEAHFTALLAVSCAREQG